MTICAWTLRAARRASPGRAACGSGWRAPPGRIVIRGEFPDAGACYDDHDPQFARSFRASRADAAIARELARCVLPGYAAFVAAVARRKEVRQVIADRRYDEVARVAQALAGDQVRQISVPQSDRGHGVWYRHELPGGGSVTVSCALPGARSVQLAGLDLETVLGLVEYLQMERAQG